MNPIRHSLSATSTNPVPRYVRVSVLIASLVLALVAGPAAAAGTNPSPQGPTSTVNPMLKASPGYHPPADPESMSVVIGRRTNAPAVKAIFQGGTRSLDDLGRAVCHALHHSDRDTLLRLCVTGEEFERIMWREFPQSRPATGIQSDDAWLLLANRNTGGISRALQDHAGRHVRFVRWERAKAATAFRNFRLHEELTLVALNDEGVEERLDLVRAVAERRGMFKLYSMKD